MASVIAWMSSGSNSSAASPATSGSDERSEQATGTPRAIASRTGRPKPSESEGKTNAVGERVEAVEIGLVEPAGKRTSASVRARSARARSSRSCGVAVARHDQGRPPLGVEPRERLEQPQQVLVRALGRDAEHDRPVAEIERRAQRRLGRGRRRRPLGRRRAGPRRSSRSARRRCSTQIVAVDPRVDDDPVRAPRRSGNEHAACQAAQAEVGVGDQLVVEVVDRRDADERGRAAARSRRGCGRGRSPRARRAAAGAAARRAPTRRGCGRGPGRLIGRSRPRARRRRGRLAVDEARSSSTPVRRRQARDQLARVDLHPAGLARHEEDEVEADVHGGAGSRSDVYDPPPMAPDDRRRRRRPSTATTSRRAACGTCARRRASTG